MPKKKRQKRAKNYDPLVKSNLSFDEMLKLAAKTPLPKKKKIKGSRSRKKK
jgi:hypothetical protein